MFLLLVAGHVAKNQNKKKRQAEGEAGDSGCADVAESGEGKNVNTSLMTTATNSFQERGPQASAQRRGAQRRGGLRGR